MTNSQNTAPTGVESDPNVKPKPASANEVSSSGMIESFIASAPHLRLTQIEFKDQTDVHNELVHEREWLLHPVEKLSLQGNLFLLENTLSRDGLIFLKHAPLPHARPITDDVDLAWKNGE